jgi:hypothetical protein
MYGMGYGVPQDFVQAHTWYNLAGASGIDVAMDNRDKMAAEMTTDQIAEAQRLAHIRSISMSGHNRNRQ